MTITSFDNGVPHYFYKEPTLRGRLTIFLNYAVPLALKRPMIRKELDKVSVIVTGKTDMEVLFEGQQIGNIRLITMTKDFIFMQ